MFLEYVRSWVRRWTRVPKVRPGRRKCAALGVEALEERSLLNAGTLDPTFGSGGTEATPLGLPSAANATVIQQSDGKVIVAGSFGLAPNEEFLVQRYKTDGTLDPTFGSQGTTKIQLLGPATANAVGLGSDGTVYVAGSTTIAGVSDMAVTHLGANGVVDPNYGNVGGVAYVLFPGGNAGATSLLVQGNKVVVGGSATIGATRHFALAGLNAQGFLDPSFGGNNTGENVTPDVLGTNEQINALAFAPGGSIVAAGATGNGQDFLVARYTKDGIQDGNFGMNGFRTIDFAGVDQANTVAVQSDGRIVVAGTSILGGKFDFALTRLLANGQDDPQFVSKDRVLTNFGGGFAQGNAVALQADGRILLAGTANLDFELARYNTDGSLDQSFGTGGKVQTDFAGGFDSAAAVALQSDGKVVLAGSATGNQANVALARYENDTLQFSAPNYSVGENGMMVTITVTRTGGSTGALSVMVATADGTGKAGQNYTPVAQQLQLADGQTSTTFTVPVLQDAVAGDGDKTVLLTLSDPSTGATLGSQDQALLTITDAAPPDNPMNPTGPVDVTAKVTLAQGKLRRKGKGRYLQQVTLTNQGGAALSGPVRLVLDGLSGKVKLRGQTKVVKDQKSLGSPVVVVVPDGGQLAAGGSMAVTLAFRAARASRIHYTPRVFAGQGLL
jgi:uncharacterized delta-60 repeat protein